MNTPYRPWTTLVLALLFSTNLSGQEEKATTELEPGKTFYLEFPDLGKTWQDKPARAGIHLPMGYSPEKTFPLFVWFGGGGGTDSPKKAASITAGMDYICVAVPYLHDMEGKPSGWKTPWSFYKAIFDKLVEHVPNIDPRRRVCGGFSSGGAAIMHQIGNSDQEFQNYFHAFIPGGAGWPMGGLDSIKGRPMLAIMGENDKRLPNFKKLDEAARAAGIDFEFLVLKNVGHKFPPECYPQVRAWLKKNVSDRPPANPPADEVPPR